MPASARPGPCMRRRCPLPSCFEWTASSAASSQANAPTSSPSPETRSTSTTMRRGSSGSGRTVCSLRTQRHVYDGLVVARVAVAVVRTLVVDADVVPADDLRSEIGVEQPVTAVDVELLRRVLGRDDEPHWHRPDATHLKHDRSGLGTDDVAEAATAPAEG